MVKNNLVANVILVKIYCYYMKARNSILRHPSGIEIETPLLIPSYSSKGFSMDKNGVSEINRPMFLCKEYLTESLLISAYDIYYKHIPKLEDFISTEIVFIDSGGYETSQLYDLSGVNKHPSNIKDWKPEFLDETLKNWPNRYPAIIVNFDHGSIRKSLDEQIAEASSLFGRHKNKLSDFIIKPEKLSNSEIPIDKIIKNIAALDNFDIIGFTEKELGNSIIKRMKSIYKIRMAMDKVKIKKPIHIFGCLDPISTILYFLVGAEIFDGLTWLKYSFIKGSAIYIYNFGAINQDIGIHTSDEQVRIKSLTNNIYFLEKMKYLMKNFTTTKDFNSFDKLGFENFGSFIESNFNDFQSNIKI